MSTVEIKNPNVSWTKSDFPKLQTGDFIQIGNNQEMRFFLNDEWEIVDDEIHPDEDYSFSLSEVTEVWRQIDCETYKKIYQKN